MIGKTRKKKAGPFFNLPIPGDKYYWEGGCVATVTHVGPTMTMLREPLGKCVYIPTSTLATKLKAQPTGPLQTCGDLPKAKRMANGKSQMAKTNQLPTLPPGSRLVPVLVTPEEMRAVCSYLRTVPLVYAPGDMMTRLIPVMQGIARGWLIG